MEINPAKLTSLTNVRDTAQCLITFLRVTCTNRKIFLQSKDVNPRKSQQIVETPKSGLSPISLAMHLASSTTGLYKECNMPEDFWQTLKRRNDKILSGFSLHMKTFESKSLEDVRILTLKTLVAVCHACGERSVNVQKVFESEVVTGLKETLDGVLKKFGLDIYKDESGSDSTDEPQNHDSAAAVQNIDPEVDQMYYRSSLVLDILKNMFEALVSATDSIGDAHEISELVRHLHEFECSGGYRVLETSVRTSIHIATSHTFENLSYAASIIRGMLADQDANLFKVECKLRPVFKALADVCKYIKQLKTNYLHGIKCRRRCHRHCDLSVLPHKHHDILGISVSRYEFGEILGNTHTHKKKRDLTWSTGMTSQASDLLKKQSKKKQKSVELADIPSLCVIGNAIHILLKNIFPISPHCIKTVMISLDTIGVCHCVQPCTFIVPLLSCITTLQPPCQDLVLDTVGRALLQRMDTSAKEPKHVPGSCKSYTPSYELPSEYHTLAIPWPELENSRLSCFGDLLSKSVEPRWLCLACYKDLLLPGLRIKDMKSVTGKSSVVLATKVSKHLASVAIHFDEESLHVLLTTVLLPVLHFVAEEIWTLNTNNRDLRACGEETDAMTGSTIKNYDVRPSKRHTAEIDAVILVNILDIIEAGLSRKETFRQIFIRHSGVQILSKFLSPHSLNCVLVSLSHSTIFDAASSCLTLSLQYATSLTMANKIGINPDESIEAPATDKTKAKKAGAIEIQNDTSSIFGRFVRGIGKSPKTERRASSARSHCQVESNLEHLTITENMVDEMKVLHSDCSEFLSTALSILLNIIIVDEEFSWKRDEELQVIEDIADLKEYAPTSSKSSGYQSKSRMSSSSSIGRDAIEPLNLPVALKSACLPDGDILRMKKLEKICNLISAVMHDNETVREEFFNSDGLKIFLRILTLVVASLSVASTQPDAAGACSETSSQRSIAAFEEYISVALPGNWQSGSSNENDKAEGSSFCDGENNPGRGEVEDVPDQMILLKLQILSSAAAVCLVCAKEHCDSEVSTADIVSLLKPPLQRNQLMCTIYCELLCKTLFIASVKPSCPSPTYCSIQTAMTLMKRQIYSQKNVHITGSGRRYALSFCEQFNGHRRPSVESNDSHTYEPNDSTTVYKDDGDGSCFLPNEQENDTNDPSDGYQGDSESDSPEDSSFVLFGQTMDDVCEPLIKSGEVAHPELIVLLVQLLGDAGKKLENVAGSTDNLLSLMSVPLLSSQEYLENVRSVISTAAYLSRYNQNNFEIILNNCDLPLAFLESFSEILQNSCAEEQDIRHSILELCLMFNIERMSADNLRLILSFFNSECPPMDQLLKYLLLLVHNSCSGPSHYIQFPVKGEPIDVPASHGTSDQSCVTDEAYTLSVWKIAPLRLPIKGNVRWPVSSVGMTISLWLQVGLSDHHTKQKTDILERYDIGHDAVVIDMANENQQDLPSSVDIAPYHHLVSIGTKQSMLQIWLEGGTLIFRICVDACNGKPVGVLAQTECPGIISTNGEWQHLTFTYTENLLPDKTILGKVHVIANCTNERDVILEHIISGNARTGSISKKNKENLTLFVGHWIRPIQTKFCLHNAPGYQLGAIMLFDGIHFTVRSAFAIYRKGPDVNNLTESLQTTNEKSAAATLSKVRLSPSANYNVGGAAPLSPTQKYEFGSYQQFFPLPHSFLISDLATEEFFTDRSLPSLKSLQEHLVLSYCPLNPTVYLFNPTLAKSVEEGKRSRSFSFFTSSTSSNHSTNAKEFDHLHFQSVQMQAELFAPIISSDNCGLNRCLSQVGGVQVFLMLCARVIEISSASLGSSSSWREQRHAEQIQSFALRTLLDLRKADTRRHEEFSSKNITAMLHKLLTKPQALVGFHTLQIIFNATCSGDDIIINHNANRDDAEDNFQINQENSALLHDQELVQVFLTDWQIWHKAIDFSKQTDLQENFVIWSLLFDGLLNLVAANHPHQWLNCKCLLQVGIVERILRGLQKIIIEDIKPFPSRNVTSKIIDLFRVLIGSPPDVSILNKICGFLIAIHPPASTFVCHSPSSFYFNLRSLKISHPGRTNASDPHLVSRDHPSEQISAETSSSAKHNEGVDGNDDSSQVERKLDAPPMAVADPQSSSKVLNPFTLQKNESGSSSKSENGVNSSSEDVLHKSSPKVTPPSSSKTVATIKPGFNTDPANTKPPLIAEEAGRAPSLHSDCNEELPYIVSELINLLYMATVTMPDMDALELTAGQLCAKCLIVGMHHSSSEVRTAMIRLLAAYFSRCSQKAQDEFLQEKGFHLVANQIHQHIATRPVVDSCLYFLFGRPTSSKEPLPLDSSVTDSTMLSAPDTFSNHAVILLLATLTKTMHDAELCKDVVMRLQELFDCVGPAADVMLDNGLTLALCNLLLDILCPSCMLLESEKMGVLKEIQHFMTCIAVKACVTAGAAHFQVSEDLFTLLHKVENEFLQNASEHSLKSSEEIQDICFDILLTVLESMQKCSGGKSLLIPKKYQSVEDTHAAMYRSGQMSKESVSSKGHVRRASGEVISHFQKNAMSRRSISTASGIPGSTESFRSHKGNLRTRSYRGSQRRRINEAETARRLQRVIIIAVDNIVYCDKRARSNDRNIETCLFNILVNWVELTLPLPSTSWSGARRGSRYGNLSNSTDLLKVWKRILSISRDSIVDQILRLIVYFMSPWHNDMHIRSLPLLIAQRTSAERIFTVLFPKDSKVLRKISVHIDHVIMTCKRQMKTEEKKALKDFCTLFQRCGGTVYRTSQHTQDSELNPDPTIHPNAISEIEKYQFQIDGERDRELKLWHEKNRSAFDQLRLRTDHLSSVVTQQAMEITQRVVLRQNIERKKMLSYVKEVVSNDLSVRNQWACLLQQLAHERAVFYDQKRYPKSWQIDATEGPNRERRRMQRCHLNINCKFFLKKGQDYEREEAERKLVLQEKMQRMISGEDDAVVKESRQPLKRELSLQDKRPLSFLFDDDFQSSDSATIRIRLQTNEKISMVQSCINVTASSETPGELLIGESCMYFVGDEKISDLLLTQALFGDCEILLLSWQHEEVMEVHNRWWQLQDIAIEIFLTNGRTYLLAFDSSKERDLIIKRLRDLELPNLIVSDSSLDALTHVWRNGGMTNFEYLTQLNKSAGRSFNDLMQYPVMPFILADYTSAILNLNNIETFRNLLRPISVPDDARMKHYQDRYRNLAEDYKTCPQDERELRTEPFHYGSHYSNSGTVLHFLVRLPPYTQMFLDYQDASFDIPDRTFHSLETTYRLSCYSSTTDVKELIPEFFFLPEFLCNLEGFDFGVRQCGLRVNHVTLPPWCKADPRLFILVHRQALESDYVSANLHGWVDLVFGYKQSGEAAIEAVNVFHPATYFGVDVTSVKDPVKRKAFETMVKTYGQTPKQLFTSSHPLKNIKSEMKDRVPQGKAKDSLQKSSPVPPGKPVILGSQAVPHNTSLPQSSNHETMNEARFSLPQRPLSSVLGLKWGKYLGSPSAPDPVPFLNKVLPDQVGSLIPLQTNDVCAMSTNTSLLVVYGRDHRAKSSRTVEVKWSAVLTYGFPDNIIRLMIKKSLPEINLMSTPADDSVTCSIVGADCKIIVMGHRSGAIMATRCNPLYEESYDLEIHKGVTLYGHYAEIMCLVACGEFRILASGSKDGTAILWDLDTLTYIRSLTGHATAVSAMAISKTSGDVCTVCESGNGEGSHIRLWTINGSLLAAQDTKDRVHCVTFSAAPEGISVNVVAAGMSNGVIRLWSSWDLMWIRDIEVGVQSSITSLTYTHDSQVVYAATCDGKVVGFCCEDKLDDRHPLLISFLNVGET